MSLNIANAVVAVSVRSEIDAPVQTVWDILLDFPSYPLWNPFVRVQAITDASYNPLLAPHPGALREGDHLLLRTRIPPRGVHAEDDRGLQTSKEIVDVYDEEHHRVGWRAAGYPGWVLRAQRTQEIVEERIDGRTVTVYTSTETFNGIAAWVIRWFIQKNLTISFQAMADALKERSEEKVAAERSS